DPEFLAKVYKVEKAMYGLHQAPRAWYGTLSKYLLTNGFQRGTIDQTLFIRRQRGDFILVHVYVDDIIFGSSNPRLCREFKALMHEKFQMSAMGELNFFLGLQVLQKKDGIFLSQDKHQVTPKECHLHAVKRIFKYLKGHPKLRLWYPKESPFDLVAYSDSDYGGATQDRKSTTGGCQFFGRSLISWQCKKQTIVATLTTEAEYVADASCCGQVLWIQNQLLDYGDCFEKKLISVDHIHTDENVVDLLTRPFDAGRFQYLVCKLFPLLGKLSTVSVFLGFGLTFAGTSKYWGILRILMISLRLIPLCEHNVDFHPIVDFVEASPLRIETTEEGTKTLATVDGILRTVTESSLRRNLKLKDEEGISSLPDAELFENLTLMGYNISPNQKFTFQKGQFSHQWKYLIHTIMQCMSPKSTGFNEFSSNIATALVCLATNRVYNFSKKIFDGMVKNVNNKGEGSCTPTEPHHTPSPKAQQTSSTTPSSPTLSSVTNAPIPTVTPSDTPFLRQYTRRTGIAQSSVLPPVADEPASPLRDPAKATLEMVAKFEAQELEIHRLKATVKLLEDRKGVVAKRSGDDALIKGRNLDEREVAAQRVSDDTEEMETVLTSMDAATVLSGGVAEFPTGSGSILTAGPPAAEIPTGSDVVPTAGLIFATATVVTLYTRRKGKETMVESETLKKKKVQEQIDAQVVRELEEQMAREDQRMSEQIARNAEIARIHDEEELQIMIDGLDMSNETVAKYLQEYHQFATELPLERRLELISDLIRYQDNDAMVHKFQTQQRKPWSKKQKRDYYMAVIKSNLGWKVKDFRGMTFEEIEAKFTAVWKQIENFIPMGSKEEAERFKRKGISSASYQFFMDMLKHLDSEDLNQLWALVKESLNIMPPTSDKEMELWVELKRLYEPDDEDQLWTHTQNLMHAPVEWKLYDTCEVHHVTSKDKEIFMLVEKDYPLRKGLAIGMISYKLQVENYSKMANDLILKIYKIASSPRQQDD
nr:hypothetical protein [Tanacetum cinerariifolium]